MAQRLSTPGALTDRLRTALGENINIDIVNQSYTTTYGVAVRAESVDRDALQIAGIVQGVNASIVAPDAGSERQLRRSNLTVEVLQQNESQATPASNSVTTRRAHQSFSAIPTGDIQSVEALATATSPSQSNASRPTPPGGDRDDRRAGYLHGFGTIRSWLGHNPAYVSATATARWHPLGTIDGWFAFIFEVGWQLIPFLVMFYAGKRLLLMLGPENIFQRNP